MELQDINERLEEMKSTWQKLRAEGALKAQWPLDAELPWGLQVQAQAELGRDCEKRKA